MAKKKEKTGKIEGQYWIWPSGDRTHMKFVMDAIRGQRPLPFGFFEEAIKTKNFNLQMAVNQAKSLQLKCTVKEGKIIVA